MSPGGHGKSWWYGISPATMGMWHLLVPGSLPASKVANFLALARHPSFRITYTVTERSGWLLEGQVERRLIRFRVRMAGRRGARLGQRSSLDELWNVLPKKRPCGRQPSNLSRAYHETSISSEAIRRFERVSKVPAPTNGSAGLPRASTAPLLTLCPSSWWLFPIGPVL
jgi:hypothetical protein